MSSRRKRERDLSRTEAFGFVARIMPMSTNCGYPQCPKKPDASLDPSRRVMVGPQVAEGAPDLYCKTCFSDFYVPENLEKFIAESGPLTGQHKWAERLHHRYLPLAQSDALIDFGQERWNWAGSWIEGRATQQAIFKREALVMASLLQHFPFIVTMGNQLYRHLRLQALMYSRSRGDGRRWVAAAFPVDRLRPSGSTLSACTSPGKIDGVFLVAYMSVAPRAGPARSKGQWVADELAAGRLSDSVLTLAQCGQADILSLLLDPEVDWAQVERPDYRPLEVARTAIEFSDAPLATTKHVIQAYPQVLGDLVFSLLESRDAELLKLGLSVPCSAVAAVGEVRHSLEESFGVRHDDAFSYECCKVIIEADFMDELPGDSIGKDLSVYCNWSALLWQMVQPARVDDFDNDSREFGDRDATMHDEGSFVLVLKLIADVRGGLLPTNFQQTARSMNFLPLPLWDWIVEHIEGQTHQQETVSLTQLVSLLHNNRNTTLDDEDLDMWDRLFSRCPPEVIKKGDAADARKLDTRLPAEFPETLCTPLGAAIAFQPLEIVEMLVSHGAELAAHHLMLAISFFCEKRNEISVPAFSITEEFLLTLTRICCRSSKFNINERVHWLQRESNSKTFATPLALLVRSPRASPDLVQKLIVNFGARPAGTSFGRTSESPLHVAVSASVISALLDQQEAVDFVTGRSGSMETPLHSAVEAAKPTDIDTSRLVVLLQRNASLIPNGKGETPLHLATAKGWEVGLLTMLNHFQQKGTLAASINLKTNGKKETVLDIAFDSIKSEVLIGMLKAYGAEYGDD